MKQHGTSAGARLFGLEHPVTIRARPAFLAALGGGLLVVAILWLRAPAPAVPPPPPDPGVGAAATPSAIAVPVPPAIPVVPELPPLPAEELPSVEPDPRDNFEGVAFELTNGLRVRSGLPPLARDDALAAAARAYSLDMLQRRFFAHVDPDGRGPAERVALIAGAPAGAVGENIWMWTGSSRPALQRLAQQAVAAWAASPGHRENILRRGYTHLGVGAAWTAGEVRLTQLFRE